MRNAFAISGVVIKEMYRRKDFYVLFVLTVLITLIMGSINIFGDDHIVRYLKEICLLLIWISALIIAVTTAARQIPAERESRTIFPLLAKPVSRAELMAGKFLGCWLASGATLLIFYLFFGVLSGAREHTWPVLNYFQALWLHWIFLAIVIAAVLLGSVVFAAPSSNATICLVVIIGILFLGGHLNRVAIGIPGVGGTLLYAAYYVMPHLEWYDVRDLITHERPLISWLACGGATLYGLGYTTLYLSLGWVVFRRKTLTL